MAARGRAHTNPSPPQGPRPGGQGGSRVSKTVAVEPSLTGLAAYLRRRGYRVVDPSPGNLLEVDAVVVSGADDNVMGIQDVTTQAPVINAHGLSFDDVVRAVETRGLER